MDDLSKFCDDLATFRVQEGACSLIKLKNWQRNLFLKLDVKRRMVEEQRERVDKKLLQLENLNYKRAYLKRQINITKDHTAVEVVAIEDELDQKGFLTINTFTEDIDHRLEGILNKLHDENEARKRQRNEIDAKEVELRSLIEVLEKKRKFIDELPAKINALILSASDVQLHFSKETELQDGCS